MTAQVQDGEHRNQVGFRREEHTVRKITHQGPPNVLLDDWNLKRILQESGENGVDLRLKAEAKTLTLALVSKRRLENLELGLSRNVEPPHLPNSAEASQQLLADLRPGAGGHLAAPVCPKALGNDLAMPVRDRDVLWMLGEMVPERLNVFELLVRRELVETRRRKRRLRHVPSISSSGPLADPPHTTTADWRWPFSQAMDEKTLKGAADAILTVNTFDPGQQEPFLHSIRSTIMEANVVGFLGFGYHEAVLERLLGHRRGPARPAEAKRAKAAVSLGALSTLMRDGGTS